MRGFIISIALAFGVNTAAAKDSVRWTLGKKDGQPNLVGMPTEDEADTEFWALCKGSGKVEVGVGANSNVGQGKGEAVSLELKSGNASAKLEGRSRESANFQMTAGSELRAEIDATHQVFAVLATGAPISVSGSMENPASWSVAGLKVKVAAFLAACRK